MAEKCFPLEATEYTAEDAQLWFATRTSGVYANGHLGVMAGDDMNVTLGKGIAWLHYDEFVGCVYGNTSELALALEMSDGQYDRIDRVCIRLERLANHCYAYIKKGTASEKPSAPELQRDNTAYEISVAKIHVGVGVTAITAADITDERLDEAVCGIMRDGVTGIDTSMMQAQFTAMLEAITVNQQASFDEWFALVKDTLDGDTAGNLFNLIEGKTSTANRVLHIPTDGWTGEGPYTQLIAVEGVTNADSCTVLMGYHPGYKTEYETYSPWCKGTAEGYVSLQIDAIPEEVFYCNLVIINPASGEDMPANVMNSYQQALEAVGIKLEATGSDIQLTDSADAPLMGLNIYGKTMQDAAPSPNAPSILHWSGDNGSVGVTVGEKGVVFHDADGLHGVPCEENETYTENGTGFVCDELDLKRGVRIQRIKFFRATEVTGGGANTAGTATMGRIAQDALPVSSTKVNGAVMCSHLPVANHSDHAKGNIATGISITSDGTLYLSVEGITVRADLVAWLAANEVYVAYALKEPIETELTSAEIARFLELYTSNPNTHITVGDDAVAKVTYIADTKAYVDSKFAELSAAMIGG